MTFKNFVIGFLIVVLLLTAYVIHAGFVVVHVKSREANVWVPVPIALGHLVGAFVNFRLRDRPEFEKALEYREAAAEILKQLKDLPDAELVEVTKPHEHVRISKRGNSLCIDVENLNEKVKVRVPLRAARRLLESLNRHTVNVGELVACLEWQPSGDIVHVQTGREEVRVSIW
jgi:hypothetical protein